jgi:putative FmdB family regulatory protein
MPIYEYKCDECGSIFENFQKITDKDIDVCQSCKKGGVKKLISSSGFRLKGSGWYETDFKGKKAKEDKPAPQSNTVAKS